MKLFGVNLVPLKLFGILMALAAAGCTGRGEVVILDLQATPGAMPTSASQAAPLKIAVVPFEEAHTIHLWSRTISGAEKPIIRCRGANR